MLKILLVRPGSTDFDDQGRIKGTLDMPLSESGRRQVAFAADQLAQFDCEYLYAAPSESALTTARAIAQGRDAKIKVLKGLRNLDHGLWHGKLIDEVRRQQPRVFRQGQERPRAVCPPGGETVDAARSRVRATLVKLLRKHRTGVVALVVPEPMASVVRGLLDGAELENLWKAETDLGNWELLELDRAPAAI